jgi:hypothetical protein
MNVSAEQAAGNRQFGRRHLQAAGAFFPQRHPSRKLNAFVRFVVGHHTTGVKPTQVCRATGPISAAPLIYRSPACRRRRARWMSVRMFDTSADMMRGADGFEDVVDVTAAQAV